MEKSPAILIGKHRLTETSLIVHWCAPELGLFKTVAKGALRPKSSFAGRLDLFVSAEIRFTRSKVSDLHTLVLAATYLVKLVELMVERETPLPGIYDLLHKALDYLNTHEPSRALIERFELRLAEDLGVSGQPGKASASLQMAVHQSLPVQRRQLFDRLPGS